MSLVLHRLDGGLGDHVQFTAVLRHLEHYQPEQQDVVAVRPGLAGIFARAYTIGVDVPYVNTLYRHSFPTGEVTDGLPGTSAVRILRQRLGLEPLWDLLRYRVRFDDTGLERFRKPLAGSPYVTLHYRGHSSPERKNLEHETALAICRYFVRRFSVVPVVFDWNGSCPFLDVPGIVRAEVPQEASQIASVLAGSRLNIAIDSGVQKLAFAVDSPCLAIWTGNHPLHCCDNAPNATHLIPSGHSSLIRGDVRAGLELLEQRYSYSVYADLLPEVFRQFERYTL